MSDDPPDRTARSAVEANRPDETELSYPEWDDRISAYREPGATVRLLEAVQGPQSWVDRTLAQHRSTLDGIRRRFEMLRPEPPSTWKFAD